MSLRSPILSSAAVTLGCALVILLIVAPGAAAPPRSGQAEEVPTETATANADETPTEAATPVVD
jgi:hypothetical protein